MADMNTIKQTEMDTILGNILELELSCLRCRAGYQNNYSGQKG